MEERPPKSLSERATSSSCLEEVRTCGRRRREGCGRRRGGKAAGGRGDALDGAGADDDHAGGGVVGLDVVDEVVALEGLDVLSLTEDGQAEGGALGGGE